MHLRTIEISEVAALGFFSADSRPAIVGVEDAMNWSLYTADRSTHLKIVVVGLSTAILISLLAIATTELNSATDIMTAQYPTVIKAGAPVVFSAGDVQVVR
jgi:hypothetical protein